MKTAERVLERRLRQAVEIDNMQFGFRPGTELLMQYLLQDSYKRECFYLKGVGVNSIRCILSEKTLNKTIWICFEHCQVCL